MHGRTSRGIDRSSHRRWCLSVQADELQELSILARDAAEILWEMVAMGEGGAAVEDMKSKGRQLQAQLRGAISDFQVGAGRWGTTALLGPGCLSWMHRSV